ncbi:MAG TPA: hypothetical protein VFS66_07675 [Acidimicrobiia bacterium]|nr:hypothetical protein [Acidimicrobiia bacterium]
MSRPSILHSVSSHSNRWRDRMAIVMVDHSSIDVSKQVGERLGGNA